MVFIDEFLRKSGIGVWHEMPYRRSGSKVVNVPTNNVWKSKNNAHGFARASNDTLWRVGTRHELVEQYNKTMHATIMHLSYALVFLLGAVYFFQSTMAAPSLEFTLVTVVCAAFSSKHFCSALGGFAGNWSDYENDPVQMIPHSELVMTGHQLT